MDNKSLIYKAAEAAIPFSVIPILFDILNHFTQNSQFLVLILGIVKFVIIVTVLNLMMKKFSREETGYVTYGRAFRYGFTMCMFSGIICTLWTVLSCYVVFPDTIETMMETIAAAFEKIKAPFDYDEIYQYLSPALIISSFIKCLFWGLVLPAILANYSKHETPFTSDDSGTGSGDEER